MKYRSHLPLALAVTAFIFSARHLAAARSAADLQPAPKRQATVTKAERLAHRVAPPLAADKLASPFNPPAFDQPNPADLPVSSGMAQPTTGAVLPLVPTTDREMLETIAAQIKPSGMIHLRDVPRLVIGNKPFEVGTRFTATYNNHDYELELVAIDRTTFTLRYRGQDTIRPIKPPLK